MGRKEREKKIKQKDKIKWIKKAKQATDEGQTKIKTEGKTQTNERK